MTINWRWRTAYALDRLLMFGATLPNMSMPETTIIRTAMGGSVRSMPKATYERFADCGFVQQKDGKQIIVSGSVVIARGQLLEWAWEIGFNAEWSSDPNIAVALEMEDFVTDHPEVD